MHAASATLALPQPSAAVQTQLGVVLDATAQSGGVGSVYTGRKTDGTRVAVKVQPASSASAAAEEARLHRLAAAPHDNLVALLQPPLVADGYHHLVITLCDRDLVDLLADFGAVPELRARDLIGQAAAGVRHLHMLGIAHRDLKLENLMLVGATVTLIDFGLSSDRGPGATRHVYVGSLAYCAPEVLNIDVARRLGGRRRRATTASPPTSGASASAYSRSRSASSRSRRRPRAPPTRWVLIIASSAPPSRRRRSRRTRRRARFSPSAGARFLSRSRWSTCWTRCSQSSCSTRHSRRRRRLRRLARDAGRARRARRAGRAGHAAASAGAGRAGRRRRRLRRSRPPRSRRPTRRCGSRRSDARRRAGGAGGRRRHTAADGGRAAERPVARAGAPPHVLRRFRRRDLRDIVNGGVAGAPRRAAVGRDARNRWVGRRRRPRVPRVRGRAGSAASCSDVCVARRITLFRRTLTSTSPPPSPPPSARSRARRPSRTSYRPPPRRPRRACSPCRRTARRSSG